MVPMPSRSTASALNSPSRWHHFPRLKRVSMVRGSAETRAAVPALHPQPAGVAALEARVRRAFDPAGVFETGRF
jgi:hypothetical protein